MRRGCEGCRDERLAKGLAFLFSREDASKGPLLQPGAQGWTRPGSRMWSHVEKSLKGRSGRTPTPEARQQPPCPHSPLRAQFHWGCPRNSRHHHRHQSGCSLRWRREAQPLLHLMQVSRGGCLSCELPPLGARFPSLTSRSPPPSAPQRPPPLPRWAPSRSSFLTPPAAGFFLPVTSPARDLQSG